MSREWKPGDVALVSDPVHGPLVMVRIGGEGCWHGALPDGELRCLSVAQCEHAARLLVVIDPTEVFDGLSESASARIAKFLREVITWQGPRISGGNDHLGRLADYFDPKLPKPEEPTGLGAGVEDAEGRLWVRVQTPGASEWLRVNSAREGDHFAYRHYTDIDAVKVLGQGWSE